MPSHYRILLAGLLIGALALWTPTTRAQSPFTDCVTNVTNATITFTMADPIVLPDGTPIESGDEVAAYTPDETCAGRTTWSDVADNILAASGPSGSPEVRDGFQAGEEIHYRIWDSSSGVVYRATSASYVSCTELSLDVCRDDGLYQTDAVFFISGFRLVVLPVELTRFVAQPDGDRVALAWSTGSEENNAGFEVQLRPETSDTWDVAGFVDGAGTTNQPQSYNFRTPALSPGTYVFRLRQVDVDGDDEFSPTRQAVIAPDRDIQLTKARPHPVHRRSALTLHVRTAQQVSVSVYDLLGRRVARLYDGPAAPGAPRDIQLSASQLASGTYFVVARGETSRTVQKTTVAR